MLCARVLSGSMPSSYRDVWDFGGSRGVVKDLSLLFLQRATLQGFFRNARAKILAPALNLLAEAHD